MVDSLNDYMKRIPADDQTPRLIVLHQMGSHGPAYYKRVPAEFKKFQPECATNAIQGCSSAELINAYDNTIVYTDHILNQLIDQLKLNTKYRTAFWYLSDHGESTGEHGVYLHGAPYAIAPSQQTHVPMMMWFSDAWKNVAANQVNCLAQQKSVPLSQDNLFPGVLKLLDIQTKVLNRQLDLLDQCPQRS